MGLLARKEARETKVCVFEVDLVLVHDLVKLKGHRRQPGLDLLRKFPRPNAAGQAPYLIHATA